jgi:hypothetical protein
LLTIHRTTFARQAANLWVIKSRLWQHLTAMARQDPALALIDSLPVPVCHFARAHGCRGFPGIASFGHDALAHQTSYGLRLHLCVTWPGVITAATLGCLVAERCWDQVRYAIEEYTWRFDGLRRRASHRRRT